MTDQVRILHGNTFVVSDDRGDIEASSTDPSGLFAWDTRFLSTWVLTVDGRRLGPLSVDDLHFYETQFFLAPGTGTVYTDAKLSVIRHRRIAAGFEETVTLINHSDRALAVAVRLDADADFADLFDVKNDEKKKGRLDRRVERGRLVFSYQRETFRRATEITASPPGTLDEHGLAYDVRLEPQQTWSCTVAVVPRIGGLQLGPAASRPDPERDQRRWLAGTPTLQCDSDALRRTYHRSLIDMAALRFSPLTSGGRSLPAAGLPWFMTMFGRDSIFTSLQALPFLPELAATTLKELADRQGTRTDDFRDEDPGRILHEMRYGESAAFMEQPHTPYYGNADATALFVVLLDEYERWSGDRALVRDVEYEARAALTWIERYADLRGDGYVWYQRRNETTGLENQCWKDSWDSICYADGRLPGFPRATCELQGYAYDARMRGARLAREVWRDDDYARELERKAAALKQRFNRDFWVADGQYYALALDADGGQVDALSSNIGHLLWSGIVPTARARAVARHLLGPRLFSGWGVRTLAEGESRYNPIGYHVGTVWPFDCSFIAWGLRRYGFKQEAARVAAGVLDAAAFFDGRLPEAFGGYHRSATKYPVQYPTACVPQAWSTGAPLLLLRTMLGLRPVGDDLVVDPALPPGIGRIELLDIPGRWGRADAFGRDRVAERRRPALAGAAAG